MNLLLPNSTGMDGRDLLFFLLVVCVCVCARFGFSFVNGTWDMMDLMDWCLCLARFTFFLIHFSAYTEKDQGGWVWVWVGLGCWFITFFLFFLERMYGSLRFRVV